MTFSYLAFGQRITSDIELPELLPIFPSLRGAESDVAIHTGLLRSTRNDEPHIFSIPNIAHFELLGTREIWVYPEQGVSKADIRPFILGTALGIILHRKGYLVLHGNVIAHGDSCTAFIGPSGAGKSTLAGQYLKQGYQILSDDLCVIQFGEKIQVMPGYPQIKLWQDSADILSISTQNLKHVIGRENKFAIPIGNQFCTEPKVLKRIFVLSNRHCEEAQLTKQSMDCHGAKAPRNDVRPIASLIHNTYRLGFLESPAERVRHLEQCQWIAKSIPIISLSHRALPDAESCLKLLDLN